MNLIHLDDLACEGRHTLEVNQVSRLAELVKCSLTIQHGCTTLKAVLVKTVFVGLHRLLELLRDGCLSSDLCCGHLSFLLLAGGCELFGSLVGFISYDKRVELLVRLHTQELVLLALSYLKQLFNLLLLAHVCLLLLLFELLLFESLFLEKLLLFFKFGKQFVIALMESTLFTMVDRDDKRRCWLLQNRRFGDNFSP